MRGVRDLRQEPVWWTMPLWPVFRVAASFGEEIVTGNFESLGPCGSTMRGREPGSAVDFSACEGNSDLLAVLTDLLAMDDENRPIAAERSSLKEEPT